MATSSEVDDSGEEGKEVPATIKTIFTKDQLQKGIAKDSIKKERENERFYSV